MSNLYVVGQLGHPYVKIGMTTRSVEKRIGDWETGSPFVYEILLDLQINPKQLLPVVEAAVHAKLHDHNIRNEWFLVTHLQVIDAIAEVLAGLGEKVTLTKLHRAAPDWLEYYESLSVDPVMDSCYDKQNRDVDHETT